MFETRRRLPTIRAVGEVLSASAVTAHMQRIVLGGEALGPLLGMEGIDVPAAWVKVFTEAGDGRAYTVRALDRQAKTLTLDFVLHGGHGASGPVSAWAAGARAGELVHLAGPRDGGYRCPADAGWMLLAGDATALPAIQSIARNLPDGVTADAYIEVPTPQDIQPDLADCRGVRVQWLPAGHAGSTLPAALASWRRPQGAGYFWAAGESSAMRHLSLQLPALGIERQRADIKGYWKMGQADHRDRG
ncbi:MAG TPA: siderophore-interacting protein [Bordetella sp.]